MKIHFPPTVWCDCALLEKNGHFALVDTGADYAKELIYSYINSLKISELDFILITHFHPDHYGCLTDICRDFNTKKVYIKKFSGLVCDDSAGKPCDDAYRKAELEKCARITAECSEFTRVIDLCDIRKITFAGTEIHLFNTENLIEKTFSGEYFCSENENCVVLYFTESKKTVLLCSDITDKIHPAEEVTLLNTKIARKINKKIHIMKAPHHGYGVGSDEALEIYSPSNVFITNGRDAVTNASEERILKKSPGAKIYFASEGGRVFEI